MRYIKRLNKSNKTFMISNIENESILLALKGSVILPHTMTPILLGKPNSIKSLEVALEENKNISIFLKKESHDKSEITGNDIHKYGAIVKIVEIVKGTKGSLKVLFEGIQKVSVQKITIKDSIIYANYTEEPINTLLKSDIEIEFIWKELYNYYQQYYQKYQESQKKIPNIMHPKKFNLYECNKIVDMLAGALLQTTKTRQDYLSINLFEDKIKILINIINKELTIFEVEKKIKHNLQNQLETTQKEFYLREQLKAIQKELKQEEDGDNFEEETIKKIKKKELPEYAAKVIYKELKRLEGMQDFSAESAVIRSYFDWILSIPWKKKSKDEVSLLDAKKILDKNHYGLKKVKETILEYIAALKYAGNKIKKPILCLIGPPGVGKTSLAKAIAQTLGKPFVRISLGGSRDEADIRGHRKTYVAAMPGKIIHAFKKAEVINPVILLDEIDKLSQDIHGNPASALLEVLDPEQNKEFTDSFIEIPYDISQAIFIATANSYENIPYPLLDRLDIINLSGYTLKEKLHIAKLYLTPKILEEHNLKSKISFTENAFLKIINNYTKEAGVRNLNRQLTKIIRKTISTYLLNNKENKNIECEINTKMVDDLLKIPYYKNNIDNTQKKIGIVNGLAWTELGGDILEIEVAITQGKGNIQLTGQLGEVMQESAQTALTYIKTKHKEFKISRKIFSESDIHIHVPEGAIPKDGPSAGITICTALTSALTKIEVEPKIAMTGEITLQGRILPIGGVKAKILAAELQNYSLVILPKGNYEETQIILSEIGPLNVKIVFCSHINEVLQQVLKSKKNTFKKKNT